MRDRIFGALPYLIPMVEVLPLGFGILGMGPLSIVLVVLFPVFLLYRLIPFGGILIFFALFFLVIRNPKAPYFIRVQTFQALILNIIAALCVIALQLLGFPLRLGAAVMRSPASSSLTITDIVSGAIFVVIFAGAVFGMIKALSKETANLPIVSEVVNYYMRLF